ncbi:hypothetical protein M378DRAFT_127665 [Amanita muscaria Koide BX008]|uniref:Lipid droplet-associated perilipin protein n=1 Tax=Amanita muscaria (strain Koide BX008) TaxID=946122 RepID=A0A0C2T9Q7_AMAMK|nr:hypothetical protein M378DRAFT_127665 [Amanita muscaria Koide BX008]
MSTETQTTTQQHPSVPELTILSRMVSIPLISSSLETINDALSSNAFTRQPYTTAKGLSTTAYRYTEPLQIRLAPLIERADGFANKAVDVVESRYPYPFKAKPEEVVSLVRERRQSAFDVANKAIDEKIKSPAYNMAQGIDQQFAPIVDYFEVAVGRLNSSEVGSPQPRQEGKFQYQRALALSKSLKEHIFEYSQDQLKQLQAQNVIVQRAMETAQAITQLASSSINSAQKRVHELSDTMLQELHKLQSSTASLSASLQSTATTLNDSASHIQHAYHDISSRLSSTASEFSTIIIDKNLPLPEKASRLGKEVQEQISPLLETIRKSLNEVLPRGKEQAPNVPQSVANGSGSSSNGHLEEK